MGVTSSGGPLFRGFCERVGLVFASSSPRLIRFPYLAPNTLLILLLTNLRGLTAPDSSFVSLSRRFHTTCFFLVLGSELGASLTGRFMTATDINFVLGKLFQPLAQNRIQPRVAANLAFVAKLLLQSLDKLKAEIPFPVRLRSLEIHGARRRRPFRSSRPHSSRRETSARLHPGPRRPTSLQPSGAGGPPQLMSIGKYRNSQPLVLVAQPPACRRPALGRAPYLVGGRAKARLPQRTEGGCLLPHISTN